ncbi:MAG: Rpn family recombination-promoting nuclease/putative transposase [Magnetococcales bacterium]|nr:Rpn family recombination-promoting nuclease/putative transposase [Magnetococcales bacterium]
MTDHDDLYHRLYSHPKLVADLMRHFVHEPWVADLDFARMKRVNAKFHVRGIRKREGDLIWRIPTRSKTPLYLLTLLEFQSRSDRWMVVRIVVYICLLWLQLVHEKQIPRRGKLPPVFPVVIYNGDPPWLVPVRLHDLIGLPDDSPLWDFQPDGRFFLLDEGRFSPEELDQKDALSALLFRTGHCLTPEELPELAKKLFTWMKKHPDFEELRLSVADLLLQTLTTLGVKSPISQLLPIDLEDVPAMLQTRIDHWKKEKKREWFQEGKQAGEQKGEATMLTRQLRHRFGTVPDWASEKIAKADSPSLEEWGRRILDAPTLDSVFAGRS